MFNTSNLFVSPLPCLVLWKVLNSPGEQADTMEAMDIVGWILLGLLLHPSPVLSIILPHHIKTTTRKVKLSQNSSRFKSFMPWKNLNSTTMKIWMCKAFTM